MMARPASRLGRRRLLRGGLALAVLSLLNGCGIALPSAPARKPARIGYLTNGLSATASARALRDAFLDGLRDLGYVEGQNIVIEYRFAEGRSERLPDLAAELVGLQVELILAGSDTSAGAIRQVSQMVPIVSAVSSAPVEIGLAESVARPGGNFTGISDTSPELSGKRLELLRETLPALARVGVLWPPTLPGPSLQFRETEAAARVMGLTVVPLEIRTADDLPTAYAAAERGRAEALVVLPSAPTITARPQIVELSARHGLPAMYGERGFVDAGGLMSYGPSFTAMHRLAAAYVDKILRGANAGDLPVQRPTLIERVINLRTAQTLGLTIPPSVLQQATELIQ